MKCFPELIRPKGRWGDDDDIYIKVSSRSTEVKNIKMGYLYDCDFLDFWIFFLLLSRKNRVSKDH